MTITDQIKILDRKIVQNEAQYDLDRKAAKISALYSNNLDKYVVVIAQCPVQFEKYFPSFSYFATYFTSL